MPHLQRYFLVCAFILALVPRAFADTAGPRVCTAASGTNWTNPTNILAYDTNYTVYNNTAQNPLNVTTCGFSIPTNATVTGVQVRVVGCGVGNTAAKRAIRVNLLGAGTCTPVSPANQPNQSPQCGGSGSDTDQTLGGTADTWSCDGLTANAVNATTFGVEIADANAVATELDEQYVEITVTYAPATTTTSTTTTTTTTTVTTTTSSTTTTTLPPRKRYRSD